MGTTSTFPDGCSGPWQSFQLPQKSSLDITQQAKNLRTFVAKQRLPFNRVNIFLDARLEAEQKIVSVGRIQNGDEAWLMIHALWI